SPVLELDLEHSVDDGRRLPDQLVRPLTGHGAVPLLVDVDAVSGAGWLPVDQDAKPHRILPRRRTEDEVEIPCVEPVGNPAGPTAQRGPLRPEGPVPGETPVIEPEAARGPLPSQNR